jgi:hypothetical protein
MQAFDHRSGQNEICSADAAERSGLRRSSEFEPSLGLTVRRRGKFDPTCCGGKPDDPPLFFEAKAPSVVTHSRMEGVLAIYKAFERWRRTDYVFLRLLPTLKSGGIRRGGL